MQDHPQSQKSCHYCGSDLLRGEKEKTSDWRVRKFCNRSYATSHKNTLYCSTHEMLLQRSTGGDRCWEWQGYLDKKGYGRCAPVNGEVLAHRVSYEEFIGLIPDGLHVLHSCDNPRCINPNHLRVGTNDDNVADRHERGRWANMKGRKNPNWKHGKYTNPEWSSENA